MYRCNKHCSENISAEQKDAFIHLVNNFNTKNEQDIYLQGLMETSEVKNKRNRKAPEGSRKLKTYSCKYYINFENSKREVCREAFISLFGLSKKKVLRLSKLKSECLTPNDMRGKAATSRHNIINGEYLQKIHDFIEALPIKEVHYSNDIRKKYLSSSLNCKLLHEMFLTKNADIAADVIKYNFFNIYFRQNFNISFGRPQVDVCSECERLSIRIKNRDLNDNDKRVATDELLIHKRRAKKYFLKTQEITKLCKERENVMAITFDYMQNLPLPKIPVQEVFYYRQLWVYEFCIHDMKNNKAFLYSYQEGQALKGPNEVCTFLLNFINEHVPPVITQLHLFSDGCPGQNKNHTVVRFLSALTSSGRFQQIHHYFPLRGHSFNDCDRDFSTIKREIRKIDRIYTHDDYINLICKSSQVGKFVVTKVSTENIIDFKKWWPYHFKKNVLSTKSYGRKVPKDQKVNFQISTFNEFKYAISSPGKVTALSFIDGLTSEEFSIGRVGVTLELPNIDSFPAYRKKIPINHKKINDLKKLMEYIPQESKKYWIEIINWPTTEREESSEQEF